MKTRGAAMKKMFVCLFTSFYALFSAFGGIPIKAQEQDPPTAIEFTQESIDQLEYEMGEDSPYAGEYLTYTVDEENNIVRVDNPIQTRTPGTIAVVIGSAVVGYLSATIMDGVVIAASGKAGAWWVAQAIQNVLHRKYTGRTYISCNVYPPNSYEGAMCRKYA